MGREVKRVPLDFDWPVGKTWPGYLIITCQSEHVTCEECRHSAHLRGMKMLSHDCPDFELLCGPPKGDGWQMWENTSEGSPISPVHETPEALAKWLSGNGASAFGSCTATYDQWLGTIKAGWACSMVVEGGSIKSGVAASVDTRTSK